MKKIIFLDQERSAEAMTRLSEGVREDCLYVAVDRETGSRLKSSGRAFISLHEIEAKVASHPDRILKRLLESAASVRRAQLNGGGPLCEKFSKDGLSYWDVIEGPLFCYHLYPLIFGLEVCRELLPGEVGRIVLPDRKRLIYETAYQYALSRGIPVDILYPAKPWNKLFRDLKINYLPWLKEVKHLFRSVLRSKTEELPGIQEDTPGKFRVLFLCFFSRQIESLLPIVRKLKEEKNIDCLVLLASRAVGRDILEKEGIPFVVLENLLEQFSSIGSRIYSFKEWKKWRRVWNDTFPSSQPNFRDTDILPLLKDDLLSCISPHLFHFADFARKFLQRTRPSLLVQVDDMNLFNRTFLLVGKLLDIPTLHLQYGLMSKEAHDWLSNKADRIAVFGPYYKDILVKAGIDERRIVPTGQPRYDLLKQARRRIRGPRPEIGAGQEGGKRILFSSVPFFENRKEFSYGYSALDREEYLIHLKALYSQIAGMEDIELLIKLHPNPADAEEYHSGILSQIRPRPLNIRFARRNGDIFQLLAECDALVTHHSTTGIEAMIFSIPLFILNLTGRPDPHDYTWKGAGVGIYKEEDIRPLIRATLYSDRKLERMFKAQEDFLKDHYSALDGKATENVVRLIKEEFGVAV